MDREKTICIADSNSSRLSVAQGRPPQQAPEHAKEKYRFEQLLAEETSKRRISEQRYQTILQTANVGFWLTDLEHRILEVNDAYCAMSGYSREDLLAMRIGDIDCFNSSEDILQQKNKILEQQTFTHETRHRCKDGSLIDIDVSSKLLAGEKTVYSFFRDITVLKRTRRDLEDRLEFEMLISGFSAALINLSQDQIDNVLGFWMKKVTHFLMFDRVTITQNIGNNTQWRVIHSYTRPGFKPARFGPEPQSSMGLLKHMIRNEQLIINRIPEDLPEDIDPKFAVHLVGEGAKSLMVLPLKAGDTIIGSVLFFSFTEYNRWNEELIRRLNLVAEIIANALLRNIADQELTQYRVHLEQVLAERTTAMAAHKESEQRFRAIFDSAMDGIMLSDADSQQILMGNPALCTMLGCTKEELQGMRVDDVHPPDTLDGHFYRFLKENRINRVPIASEMPVKRIDGSIFYAHIAGSIFDLEGKSMLAGVFRDVTDRKKAEAEKDALQKQLLQAQKMEAVGMLAGGVAHDFNNMLSVVIGYSELQMLDLDRSSAIYSNFKAIHDAAQRSATLVHQLLAFARKQTIEPKVLDFNNAIATVITMLRRLIGEDIDLVFKPGHATGQVKIDPAQIDQIMANLVVNARDAINGVGKITIETEHVVIDETYCSSHIDSSPGSYVCLIVRDDGCGMDSDTMDKIFDPFFSTKAVGQGTGLGLATVYGIVKQNKGFINVFSEPGGGTAFKLYFPRITSLNDQPAISGAMGSMPKGSETILMVEDDPIILDLGKTILAQLGYTVLCAGMPQEALRLAQTHSSPIDLLLTDVVMPQMNGKELAKQLSAFQPRIKCLYMSGYTADVISHHGVLDEGVVFVQKPFPLHHLAAKVREVLEKNG